MQRFGIKTINILTEAAALGAGGLSYARCGLNRATPTSPSPASSITQVWGSGTGAAAVSVDWIHGRYGDTRVPPPIEPNSTLLPDKMVSPLNVPMPAIFHTPLSLTNIGLPESPPAYCASTVAPRDRLDLLPAPK